MFFGTTAFAVGSSASYKISSEIIDAGSAASTSSSYKLLGKARERQVQTPASANFTIGEGFLKAIYFSAQPILAPIIISITPNTAANTGTVNISDLSGTNFSAGATVRLSRTNEAEVIASNVVVVSSSKITCTFDLTGITAGFWDVVVTNPDGKSGKLSNEFKIINSAPNISSITPASGFNNGIINITNLSGLNFRNNAVVSLSKLGETDIAGTNVVIASSSKITCQFNLNGKTTGLWDVVVLNDDGQKGILPGGFKIETPSVSVVGVVVSSANPYSPASGNTTLKYTLTKDATITLYMYNIRGERIWQRVYPAGTQGGQVGLNEIVWDGMTDFKSRVSFGVYILMVTTKDVGTEQILSRTKIAVVK